MGGSGADSLAISSLSNTGPDSCTNSFPCREFDDRGAAVRRVRSPGAVARSLQSVDGLARAADRDREGGGYVVHPAGTRALHDQQHVQPAQGHSAVLAEPGVDPVPQVGLEAHQVVEELP